MVSVALASIMINIQKRIIELMQHSLTRVGIDFDYVDIALEHPADFFHGDYACNIAMRLAKKAGKNPRSFAEEIIAKIPEDYFIKRIEIAGPGFINFYLSDSFFESAVQEVIDKKQDFGRVDILKGKKILAEKTAPNLFKPFHVGHLLNLSIGESLVRIVQFAGAQAIGVAYPSDISLGVAKAIWALQEKGLTDFDINTMGQCYAQGSVAYEKDEKAKQRIIEINKHLNAGTDAEVQRIYKKGRELNLEYFVKISKRLGSIYDDYFFESQAGEVGKEIVQRHIGDVFTQSQGAVIFEGEKYGLHTRVFLTAQGLAVYETKDIGLIQQKFEKYNPDVSIVITDIEQKQYFEVIKKVATLIFSKEGKSWGDKSLYLQHGRLRFEGGKISSRYGNVPLAEDLIEQVKSLLKSKDENVNEQVAIAALKYSFLKVNTGKNIVFDFKKSIAVDGDSGPYLQYTYARCKSVLAKAYSHRGDYKAQMPKGWEVTDIERLLYRFPKVVERAATEYEPHYIANYLNDLASAYNSWYGRGKILDGTDAQRYKLVLTQATAHTLKNGLYLLGIDAPERM